MEFKKLKFKNFLLFTLVNKIKDDYFFKFKIIDENIQHFKPVVIGNIYILEDEKTGKKYKFKLMSFVISTDFTFKGDCILRLHPVL